MSGVVSYHTSGQMYESVDAIESVDETRINPQVGAEELHAVAPGQFFSSRRRPHHSSHLMAASQECGHDSLAKEATGTCH